MRRTARIVAVIVILLCIVLIGRELVGGDEQASRPPSSSSTTSTATTATPQHRARPPRHKINHHPTLAEKRRWFLAVLAANADYHNWPDWYVWQTIGRCEQGGYAPEGDGIAWHGQPIGGSAGSNYPGGLGIMRAAWDENRERAGVTTTNGAYASPADQIRVARVIRERFGLRAWECGKKHFPGS